MAMELQIVGWAGLLVLVQLVLAGAFRVLTAGVGWGLGNRDAAVEGQSVTGQRAARAAQNMLETFPVFAAAAIGVVAAGASTPGTVLGAQIYLAARVAYVPAYLFYVPGLRSVVWIIGCVGLLMVLWPLIVGAVS